LADGTVTISTGDKSVTVPAGTFSKMAADVSETSADYLKRAAKFDKEAAK
jgi:hypothetical protein